LKGSVVYVDFWASWCVPCRLSMPALEDLYRRNKSRGFAVVGVNKDASIADARRFLAKVPVSFALVQDGADAAARGFDVKAMPSGYLVDRKGLVCLVGYHLRFPASKGDGWLLKEPSRRVSWWYCPLAPPLARPSRRTSAFLARRHGARRQSRLHEGDREDVLRQGSGERRRGCGRRRLWLQLSDRAPRTARAGRTRTSHPRAACEAGAAEVGEIGFTLLGYKERGLMKITEPVLWGRAQFLESWEVQASAAIDIISGASPRLVTNASGKPVQTLTGASVEDRRNTGDVKLTKHFGDFSLAGSMAYSD
jgi:hypothetical protein